MPASTPPASTVLDADLDRTGDVVVAMRAESGVDVHFLRSGATQRLATPMLRPAVRWINPARALLYDEWGAESERNALIVDENGITDSPFAIGGAVADVVSVGKYVAATYTDEGALGDDERSQAGIALFDRRGECLWMWNSSAARDLAPVFDCYAVGQGSDTTLGFLFYTLHDAGSYAFGLLDMETRGVTLFETPEVLHRTRAVGARRNSIAELLIEFAPRAC
jgi:hypothetical protein